MKILGIGLELGLKKLSDLAAVWRQVPIEIPKWVEIKFCI